MKSTATYKQPTSVIALGAPGTGKTTFLCQFPKPFILDCDNNLSGPLRWLKEHNQSNEIFYGNPFEDEEGKVIPREQWYPRASTLLQEACDSPLIETVIVDSLTSFVDIAMTEVLRQQGRKIGAAFDFKNKSSKSFDEPMQIQDWGAFFGLMKQIVFRLKATGKMIIYTGHIANELDSASGMIRQCIACPGKFADVMSGFFSEVWLFESFVDSKTKEERRTLRTFPQSKQMESLGLKSSVGIKSGEALDPQHVLSLMFPPKQLETFTLVK